MMDAETLTFALGGKWHQRYGLAFCPAHENRRTPALALADGDDGRLLAYCHAGCTFEAVIDALRARGLLETGPVFAAFGPLPERVARHAESEDARKRAAQAGRLWNEALLIAGTPAETYLRGRGIICPLPETLRFHPECWHATARRFPAMVARVDRAERFAVHRTYLAVNGGGKAPVDPDKAMLGRCAGGAVRLSDERGPLVVAEGIETALSLLCGLLNGPATVWAGLSTSGVKGLHLPPTPGRLIVAPDNDPAGLAAAHALAARAAGFGWHVSALPAPEQGDWNDFLRAEGGAP